LKRSFEKKLLSWKNKRGRKPLIVRGARQVGKTYSINKFGEKYFDNIIYVNFERDSSYNNIFEGDLIASNLLMKLEVAANQRIIPKKTLIFFDEIQVCSRALMSLRYFYEEYPSLHIIAAGSLLEFTLQNISFPVGRVEYAWLFPMNFSEFLLARKMEILEEKLPFIFDSKKNSDVIHEKILSELVLYFIVGGMPEVVGKFIETNSLAEVAFIQKSLCFSYIEDLGKHGRKSDKECLWHIFEQIPSNIGKQIKYKSLYPEKRIEKIKDSLKILEKSLLIHKVKSSTATGLPLGATVSEKVFKLIFLDIGLMQHLCGVTASILEAKDLLDIYRGSLAEQFVGQELLANTNNSGNNNLFYWSRSAKNSNAEVDFLMVNKGEIFPVEVKSGVSGRLKSMHLFLKSHDHCPKGLVLSSRNLKEISEQKITFLPLYSKWSKG